MIFYITMWHGIFQFRKARILLFAILVIPLLLASCLSDTSPALGRTYQGPILQLTLEDILTLSTIAYTEEDDAVYIIRPASDGNELVAISARIGNHAATKVQLDINAQPSELRMDSGRYHALNTSQLKVPATGFHPDKDLYVPFIRGSQELEKDFELHGWIIFDVPKDSKLESFKWEAGGDIIIIDL